MKCISCGAEIKFDPKLKELKCDYCGSTFDAKTYKEQEKRAKEVKEVRNEIETKSYSCKSCGASLLVFDDTAVTFCSYCGSSMTVEPELYKLGTPDFVIPFKLTKEECEKKYISKINKLLFAPSYMKDKVEINKFRGIYMPYALYKSEHHGPESNKGSKYTHTSGDYQYYDDYKIDCDIDCTYDGIAYDITSNFEDKYSRAIGPFNVKDFEEFKPSYLSGFYADSSDVNQSIYSSDALMVAEKKARLSLGKVKEIRKYNATKNVHLNTTETKTAYFPVYFLAIKNKKNNLINYAVMNGSTGKIAIDAPVSFIKYLIFTLMLSIPLFMFLNLIMVLTPQYELIFSIVLNLITLIISYSQLKKIHIHENRLDDKGINSKINNKEKVKSLKFGEIFKKYLYKQVIGILICIIILILNPVDDYYYYGASIISLLIVLISFKDLLTQHNKLVSRKPVQLGKRGGDEHE